MKHLVQEQIIDDHDESKDIFSKLDNAMAVCSWFIPFYYIWLNLIIWQMNEIQSRIVTGLVLCTYRIALDVKDK